MSRLFPASRGARSGAATRRSARLASTSPSALLVALSSAAFGLGLGAPAPSSALPPVKTVLMGDGDLTYSEGVKATPAGDMNGDGIADGAVLKRRKNGFGIDDTVHVLHGTRSGQVPGSLDALGGAGFQILSGEQITSMTPGGDFDGDGLDDLVVQRTSGFAVIYGAVDAVDVNTQTATPRMTKFPVKWGEVLPAGDFNGDGIDDLLVNVDIASTVPGFPAYNVVILGGPRVAAVPTTGPRVFTISTPVRCTYVWWVRRCTGNGAIQVKPVGDYSGDGLGDLAITTVGKRTQTILFGRASGNAFDPQAPAPSDGYALVTDDRPGATGTLDLSSFPYINALDSGDRNGDGRADLLISSTDAVLPRVWGVYASRGAGTVALSSLGDPLISGAANAAAAEEARSAIGDFDGDAKIDHLRGNSGYQHPAEEQLQTEGGSQTPAGRGGAELYTYLAKSYSSPPKITPRGAPEPVVDPGLVVPFGDITRDDEQWTRYGNGTAFPAYGTAQLTPAQRSLFGVVYWPKPMNPANKTYEFDATISGGVGAGVGMTVGFGSTTLSPGPSLGGAALGFGGLGQTGVAVAFVTAKANRTDPSSNFVGITNGRIPGSSPLAMRWLATADPGFSLRAGKMHVKVVTGSASIQVSINGQVVLNSPVTLPTSALLQFTAATGPSNYQDHRVKNVSVR